MDFCRSYYLAILGLKQLPGFWRIRGLVTLPQIPTQPQTCSKNSQFFAALIAGIWLPECMAQFPSLPPRSCRGCAFQLGGGLPEAFFPIARQVTEVSHRAV
jgi:hypothetical protein